MPTRSSNVARSSRISASLAGDWLPAAAGPMISASDLVELAVAAFLRTLSAKHRADREELIQAPLPKFVLDVGADDAGGVLGAEGERLSFIAFGAAAILPGEHFFETMSVSSPTPRANSSVDSKMGVRISWKL